MKFGPICNDLISLTESLFFGSFSFISFNRGRPLSILNPIILNQPTTVEDRIVILDGTVIT